MKNISLVVMGLLSSFIFALITALVIMNTTQGIDASLALALNKSQGMYFSSLMIVASEYGREYFWIPVVAFMLLFGRREVKLLAIELAVLFVVGIAAGEILKVAYFRPRPFVTLNGINLRVPTNADSSFPSGHALIVSIGAIFSLMRFKGKQGKILAVLFALEAGFVCYSRVYVGAHYPTDVVGGIFLGSAIAFLGVFVMEEYFTRLLDAVERFSEKVLGALRVPMFLGLKAEEKRGYVPSRHLSSE